MAQKTFKGRVEQNLVSFAVCDLRSHEWAKAALELVNEKPYLEIRRIRDTDDWQIIDPNKYDVIERILFKEQFGLL